MATDPIASTRVLTIGVADLIYDPISSLLYTVHPFSTPLLQNSISAIDPVSGTQVGTAPTNFNP